MVKDIFDTILEKEFHQLTASELAEMEEFCKTEEAFNAMKQVLIHSKSVAGGPKLSPRDATKEKLDNLFDQTHVKTRRFIPSYLIPVIQVAAVVTIGFAVWFFFLNNHDAVPATQQLAENTAPKSDTITPEKSVTDTQTQPLNVSETQLTTREKEQQADNTSGRQQETPAVPPIVAAPNANTIRTFSMKSINPSEQEVITETVKEESVNADQLMQPAQSTYKKVSAPATSAKDISVDASKRPFKNQAATSVNVASQGNVINYLTARY